MCYFLCLGKDIKTKQLFLLVIYSMHEHAVAGANDPSCAHVYCRCEAEQ